MRNLYYIVPLLFILLMLVDIKSTAKSEVKRKPIERNIIISDHAEILKDGVLVEKYSDGSIDLYIEE
ncbi:MULTISPECIES: hypothetical protein [Flammeovirga]|uniref:Uncharacterized protein n=1 Tax=Flammeovirga agarivorans TaxID=2726742 RepID=A0A7X8SRF8_9BACT|nr:MULTISPECIES: hypothetical protein [Flammeovirga]NLR95005.1 hypothetical protein [Flammeovirga agarivorans]